MATLKLIFIDIGRMRVAIWQGRRELDALDVSFSGDLDTLLIGAIDKILKRTRISLLSLQSVSVGGSANHSSLAWRVAQTCATVLRKTRAYPGQ